MTLQELPPAAPAKPAFEALYEQYHSRIVGFLLNRLRTDQQDAEDLAHDAFTKMWAAWPRFEYRSADGTDDWIYQVALNVLRDATRHRKLVKWQFWDDKFGPGKTVAAKDWPRITSHDPLDDPQTVAHSNDGVDAIRQAIAGLSWRLRPVLSLYALHERTYDEIGDILGLSHAAVKSRLWRARIAVRANWTQEARQ